MCKIVQLLFRKSNPTDKSYLTKSKVVGYGAKILRNSNIVAIVQYRLAPLLISCLLYEHVLKYPSVDNNLANLSKLFIVSNFVQVW